MEKRANVRHRVKFHGNRTNHCWDMVIFRSFQYGSRPPSWICCAIVWTTHKSIWWSLLQCIIWLETNIDKVVLIICMSFYFAILIWKCLFTPKIVFGGWPPKRGDISTKPRKRTSREGEISLYIYKAQLMSQKLDNGASAGDEIWNLHSVILTQTLTLTLLTLFSPIKDY